MLVSNFLSSGDFKTHISIEISKLIFYDPCEKVKRGVDCTHFAPADYTRTNGGLGVIRKKI